MISVDLHVGAEALVEMGLFHESHALDDAAEVVAARRFLVEDATGGERADHAPHFRHLLPVRVHFESRPVEIHDRHGFRQRELHAIAEA